MRYYCNIHINYIRIYQHYIFPAALEMIKYFTGPTRLERRGKLGIIKEQPALVERTRTASGLC